MIPEPQPARRGPGRGLSRFAIVAALVTAGAVGALLWPRPIATPAPLGSRMWVGVDAGQRTSTAAADIRGAVRYVRLETAGDISGWRRAGVKVIDDISGPYQSAGVSALDAADWARNAVNWYRSNGPCAAIEVLNEPGGTWYWGPDARSVSNATAYARLLKAVHEAFAASFGSGRPLLLGSYDGGYSHSTTWGEEVWAADPNIAAYVDGITMHPYGGATGDRENVINAHRQTGKPVFVTEVGWSTDPARPVTDGFYHGTEKQQADNAYDFINWARSTGYVQAVIVFNLTDFGTRTWWGIERQGEGGGSVDGSRKPSYYAIREADEGRPLSCSGC